MRDINSVFIEPNSREGIRLTGVKNPKDRVTVFTGTYRNTETNYKYQNEQFNIKGTVISIVDCFVQV